MPSLNPTLSNRDRAVVLLASLTLLATSGCAGRQSLEANRRPETASGGKAVSATVSAENDYQQLLRILLQFSKQMLQKQGEFYPFAAAIDMSGQSELFSADTGDGERTNSAELTALLMSGLDKGRADGQYRASGVCFPATTTIPGSVKKTDAIKVVLRRTNTPDRNIVIPYRKRKSGRIEFGAMHVDAPADGTNPDHAGLQRD